MILDKKQIYRIYTVLSFLLLIRHSQYYIFANVSTEYGFNQPIWGIALIPITAAFGTSFCIGRRTVLFNNSDYYRLAFVSLLPIVLTILYGFNLGDIFEYSVYDTARRPPFLILLPIALAVLIYDSLNKLFSNIDLAIVCLCTFLILVIDNFIIYYSSMMVAAAYIINYLANNSSSKFFQIAYIGVILFIYSAQVVRTNGLFELIMVIGFLFSVKNVASILPIPNIKFSILEFYIAQAVIFTFIPSLILGVFGLIATILLTYGSLFALQRLKFANS